MKGLNYTEVPTTQAESLNVAKETWKDGRIVSLDEGRHVTLYLGHRTLTRTEASPDGEAAERTVTEAFAVRVAKPLTKAAAVNAAEMAAYGLRSAMDVASLNASLARKWRENVNDMDVREHDELVAWVKEELAATGMFAPAEATATHTESVTLADMSRLVRMRMNGLDLTDEEALSVKSAYPDWEEFIGKELKTGMKVQHGGKLYKARQDVNPVLENQPPSVDTAALYEEINETHAGTAEDPIPYNNNMTLEEGKYYSQDGEVYLCTRDTEIPVYNPLKDLVGIYVEVV